MSFKYDVSICAIYKNEGIYLQEWIEYHLMIGFDHFYLYNNNSTDDHYQVIKKYIDLSIVTYNEYTKDVNSFASPQQLLDDPELSYNHSISNYKDESKYIAFIDIDEFIVLYQCDSIKTFMNEGQYDVGIAINWVLFGSSSNYFNPKKLVTESYFLRPPKNFIHNDLVKSIINPRLFLKWDGNVHLPLMNGHIVKEDHSICTNLHSPIKHNKISLFHYRLKSKEHFIMCKLRKFYDLNEIKNRNFIKGESKNNSFKEMYYGNTLEWEESNSLEWNLIEDFSIFKRIPELKKRLGINTETVTDILNTYIIDPTDYIKLPGVIDFIKENRKHINNVISLIFFHYFFYGYQSTDIKLIKMRDIMANKDLNPYRLILNELKFLSNEEVKITDNIVNKYVIDNNMAFQVD